MLANTLKALLLLCLIQAARTVAGITARGYPPLIRGIGGYRLWRYSPYRP